MAKIIWTNESLRCLKEIDEHIAKDGNEAAARVVEGIYEKVQLLNDHPRAGFRYLQVRDVKSGFLLYGRYRVFYEVIDDDRVTILGIFHAALDVQRYLS